MFLMSCGPDSVVNMVLFLAHIPWSSELLQVSQDKLRISLETRKNLKIMPALYATIENWGQGDKLVVKWFN